MKLNIKCLLGAVVVMLFSGSDSCFAGGVGDALNTIACAAKKVVNPANNDGVVLRFQSLSCQIPARNGANVGLALSTSPTMLPSIFDEQYFDPENQQFLPVLVVANPTSVLLPPVNVLRVNRKVSLPRPNGIRKTEKTKKATHFSPKKETKRSTGEPRKLPLQSRRLRPLQVISRDQKNDRVRRWIEQEVDQAYTPVSLL